MASRSVFPSFARPSALALGAALAWGCSLEAIARAEGAEGGMSAGGRSYSLGELDLPDFGGPSDAGSSDQKLHLEIFFDQRATGQLAQLRLRDGRLHGTPAALRSIGLVVDPALSVDRDGLLALDALPGLGYRYDVAAQRLVLTVPPALRPRQTLGYQAPAPVQVTRSAGLLLNYDAYARSLDDSHTLSVSTMARWFGPAGALETSALSRAGDDADGYQRLDTRWSYSDPVRLSTWTAGDLISGGLAWTRPVRLGGVQWRRNFGVRPDLITFPVPRFTGQATVPSAVELLINNVKQFDAQVDDGPFVLDTFPRISGAGVATLVVRDALGRSTQTSVPIYVDYQRLAPGLSDFSLEAGTLRRGYASDQDRYDGDIVASGSYRRGLSDTFTIEGHGEYGPDLRVAGLGGVWAPAGRGGVVTAAVAHSGWGAGSQRTYGYQWMNPRFGMDWQVQRRSRGFRDIGDLAEDMATPSSPLAQDRASFWWSVPRGSVGFSWLRWRTSTGHDDRIRTLSWSQLLGKHLYANLSMFDSASSGRGYGLSLSLPLGPQRHASLSLSRPHGGRTEAVADLRQSAPYDGGWGWDARAGDRRGGFAQASAHVRGRYGEAAFGADHIAGRNGYFGQGNGSLVWMGGAGFASRRISDAFAVVSSNGVPDVPVLYENRLYGHTNARGFVLLPDLRGWQRNRVAIDPDGLGVNFRAPPLEHLVTPADSGGVLLRFDVARVQPALVTLLGRDGAPVAAGSSGRVSGSLSRFLVGLDGEAYLDDLGVATALELDGAGGRCHYTLPAAASKGPGLARIGPLRCLEIL